MIEFGETQRISLNFDESQKIIIRMSAYNYEVRTEREQMIDAQEVISGKQLQPGNAAVVLQRDFERFASHMRHRDSSLQDDLVQEMSLGVLQCTEPHSLSYFRSRALSRAKDFLKMWQRKSCADWMEIKIWPAEQSSTDEKGREWYVEKINALMALADDSVSISIK